MKKIMMISVVAVAMLLVGCGDKTKEAGESISAATDKAVEATKDAVATATTKAADTVKDAESSIATATDKAAEATKEAASEAVDSTKESVAKVAVAVADKAQSVAGAAAYAKCAGCHGADGKTKALGKSEVIAGQSKEDLVMKITEYKAGTRNTAGMGTLMKGQVAPLSDADIDSVAGYISTLK